MKGKNKENLPINVSKVHSELLLKSCFLICSILDNLKITFLIFFGQNFFEKFQTFSFTVRMKTYTRKGSKRKREK